MLVRPLRLVSRLFPPKRTRAPRTATRLPRLSAVARNRYRRQVLVRTRLGWTLSRILGLLGLGVGVVVWRGHDAGGLVPPNAAVFGMFAENTSCHGE